MLEWRNGNLRLVSGRVIGYQTNTDGSTVFNMADGDSFTLPNAPNVLGFITAPKGLYAVAIVDDKEKVIGYKFWPHLYKHERLVDEKGVPLIVISGMLCQNIENKTVQHPRTGKPSLRCSLSIFRGNKDEKSEFYRLHFDGLAAVAANGVYQNKAIVLALVRDLKDVTKKDDVLDYEAEGISMDTL